KMNYKHLLISAGIIGFAMACSSSKKTQTTSTAVAIAEPAIDLDTIRVIADEPVKKKVYRASETKSNDIIHTKLWVSFDWQKSQMTGKAELLIKPYFYPTNMLYLNARGMDIKSVSVAKRETTQATGMSKDKKKPVYVESFIPQKSSYKYENDSIKIDLGSTFTKDDHYTVTIEYIAKPNELKEGGSGAITSDKGLYFINPTGADPDKMPQIWTQGETQSNSAWFPTNDN